ncbi:MAG: hypothetical protein QM752_03435 [Gammaproteobacteria bacterium]
MSMISKAGVVLASGVAVAFSALTGCASQQSGAATPANLPNNCAVYAQPAPTCKGQAHCKHKCYVPAQKVEAVKGAG